MGIQLGEVFGNAKSRGKLMFSIKQHFSSQKLTTQRVPRGHFAVYVGDDHDQDEEKKKRFVVPISYLKHPVFQSLLKKAAEEFGYDHGIMDGLIVPCSEYFFLNLISQLNKYS